MIFDDRPVRRAEGDNGDFPPAHVLLKLYSLIAGHENIEPCGFCGAQ
jgi:hypothetical protein